MLIDFAKNHRQGPSPGVEVIVTAHYRITLMPDFPLPGPNSVAWIRCAPEEADDVISEANATVAARKLPLMWVLDPDTQPPDFAGRLEARGYRPDTHGGQAKVMVLPANANVEAPIVPGLEIQDALADPATFKAANDAAAEAFMSDHHGDEPAIIAMNERRRKDTIASLNRRLLLATVNGEPAGSGSLVLFPPSGAVINGGSVRPKFRGLGVYRSLVAARHEIARQEGAAGLVVQAGAMSEPILSRLGFEPVSWRRYYV
jgi:acetyltransferase (GNAT) family protein